MCDRQILARYFCIRNLSIWSLMIGCGLDSHLWLLGLLDALDKNFFHKLLVYLFVFDTHPPTFFCVHSLFFYFTVSHNTTIKKHAHSHCILSTTPDSRQQFWWWWSSKTICISFPPSVESSLSDGLGSSTDLTFVF